MKRNRVLCITLATLALCQGTALAETLWVNATLGDDLNPGTREQPLQTLHRAVDLVNWRDSPGPTTVKLEPGIHRLGSSPLVKNERSYSKTARLVIEASVLPDSPEWSPSLMPVIVSTQEPEPHETGPFVYGLRVEISHVTIRGLKFIGHPALESRYYPIWRGGDDLKDLVVSQNVFVGDRHSAPIHLAVIANGHGLVVENSIFLNCKNTVVFWGAEGGTSRGNVMRYNIVYGSSVSGIWTDDTGEDLEFHNNIITRGRHMWIRATGSDRSYRLRDSVLTQNEAVAGFMDGPGSPPTESGHDFLRLERGVVRTGAVDLVMDPRSRTYLHVATDTLGSELGAGLFKLGTSTLP